MGQLNYMIHCPYFKKLMRITRDNVMKRPLNKSLLSNLRCTACKSKYESQKIYTTCPRCGKILFAEYELEKAKENILNLENRSFNIWRFSEIMPVINPKYQYTLGEGWTPLLKLRRSAKSLKKLFLKDEGLNPTGTFKSRGLCAAVSKAKELGITKFVIPTAGNAGAALAAYCACVGAEAHIFMPSDTPEMLIAEVRMFGGNITLVDGLINIAATLVHEKSIELNWFDVSTLKEPYRVEGKKTMAFEIVEQNNWEVPDVIIYPTGGGTGIVGMWKAFNEMEGLGLIGSKRPRMVSVQTEGCAPIWKAFQKNQTKAEEFDNASTLAPGLRVPKAFGDYLILRAIYDSGGTVVKVTDAEIIRAMNILAKDEGILQAPEAAATYASLDYLLENKFLDKSEEIILFGTGSGLIYPHLW